MTSNKLHWGHNEHVVESARASLKRHGASHSPSKRHRRKIRNTKSDPNAPWQRKHRDAGSIPDLPDEIWATCIFRFLDCTDLSIASRVCRSWKDLVETEAWPHGQRHHTVVGWMQTLDSHQGTILAERALRRETGIHSVEALWSVILRDCGLAGFTCADMRLFCAAAPGMASAIQGLALVTEPNELLVECVSVCQGSASPKKLREILGTDGGWSANVLAHPAVAIMLRALRADERGLVALSILDQWLSAEEGIGQTPMDAPHGGCLVAFATNNMDRLARAELSLGDLRTLSRLPSFVIMAFTSVFRDRWIDAVGALLQFTRKMKDTGVHGARFAYAMQVLGAQDTQRFSVDVVVQLLHAV
jgi:hypothetical protein